MGVFGESKVDGTCDCCDGQCNKGCCIPIDHSNPIYEPYGTPKNIPFQIVAPSCPALNGYEGELFCGGAVPVQNKGDCGPCLSCVGGGPDNGNFNLIASRRIELGPLCNLDSCSIILCLVLTCEANEPDNQDVERCCQRFRLKLGISAGGNAHIDGEDPDLVVPGSACNSWRKVEPITCECGATESDFPAIVFPIGFSVLCDEVFEGSCVYFSKCCDTLIGCDLSDATLVI